MDKIPQSIREMINNDIRKVLKALKIEKGILSGSYAKGTTH